MSEVSDVEEEYSECSAEATIGRKIILEEEDPAYWFKEFWLHCLYCDGLEMSMKQLPDTGVPYAKDDKRRLRGGMAFFHWELILKHNT